MNANTRAKLREVASRIGAALLVLSFACAFVAERTLHGLHQAARLLRTTLAGRLPARFAAPAPTADAALVPPAVLDDVEASLHDLRQRAA